MRLTVESTILEDFIVGVVILVVKTTFKLVFGGLFGAEPVIELLPE